MDGLGSRERGGHGLAGAVAANAIVESGSVGRKDGEPQGQAAVSGRASRAF